MKALIIEDSRLSRLELKELLKTHKNIHLCGEASNSIEAIEIIQKEHPDLIFLDINLPGQNGFGLLEQLDYRPKVIFITAHAEHAIRSFDYTAVDFLLKPISNEKLQKALRKLELFKDSDGDSTDEILNISSRVLLRDNNNCHLVMLQDIEYFESVGNYTEAHWKTRKAMLCRSLIKIEERLPPEYFFRANRQHIININKVASIEPWINGGYQLTLECGLQSEVSRRHAIQFKDVFSL
ncbi:MAG: LytTR family DNA-binding domain-containing protein [Pseudomonadota bacterium]